ncbi:hypothetical protein [Kiloniella antarctica]|uniref:Uncharacterized protein n=1 Tax=Kiloniella antarctica TaxID=1550907 RepID=A0ABW5BH86_9PROT
MSDLEELRQRVEAAEENFGLIADQQKGYSQRLIALLNVTEQKDQAIGKLENENEQLRSMLFSLLQAIEKGDTSNTLQDMDVRISAMTSQTVDIANESPAQNLTLSAPDDEPTQEVEALEDNSEDDSFKEKNEEELLSDQAGQQNTDSDSSEDEGEMEDEEVGELPLPVESSPEAEEALPDDTVLESTGLENEELSESEIPDDSEDDLIAEIAESLELALPDEEPESEDETSPDESIIEDFVISDSESAPETEQSTEEDILEGLEDPLEDALLADGAKNTDKKETQKEITEPEDIKADDPGVDDTETEGNSIQDTDIDAFLDENANEDETAPASPEIEDIMERISKQALSQND